MISKRDSKPFLIKFASGVEKTSKKEMQYDGEWQTCYGIISDTISGLNPNIYGYEVPYDKTIIVNAGSLTRSIDYDTLVIIDNYPTSVYAKGDYSITRIYPEYNGQIVLGLSKINAVNIPKLYFIRNGTVLYYQLNFDKDTNIAYVPSRAVIPFTTGQYVWTKQPTDENTTTNRLVFSGSEKVGIDNFLKRFNRLTFSEV